MTAARLRSLAFALTALGLAACAAPEGSDPVAQDRVVPGSITVMASEGGHLRNWRIVPCGTQVCATDRQGAPQGRPGTVEDLGHEIRISGLYGRLFRLVPGGDGIVERSGTDPQPASWEVMDRPWAGWIESRLNEGGWRDAQGE